MEKTLEQVIEKIFVKSQLTDVLLFNRIVEHWEVIVGESLVKVTKPLTMTNKCLFIGVHDASYAQHLLYFQDPMLSLLASPHICGENKVTKIVFRVVSFPRVSNSQQQKEDKKETETDSLQENIPLVKEVAYTIQDYQIRTTFSRFMQTILRRESD